jgi:hypothetical protein
VGNGCLESGDCNGRLGNCCAKCAFKTPASGSTGGSASGGSASGGGSDSSSAPIIGSIVALVLALALYYYRTYGMIHRQPTDDKAKPLLGHDSLNEATHIGVEMKALPIKSKVFISWRMAESKAEVTALTKALEALPVGVEVIVIRELAGGKLLKAVSQGMTKADMFVIMGTKTYGTTTSGLIDTNKEMQHIITSKKPYLLLNMNPESSLLEFKEPDANLVLNLKKEPRTWERWEVGQPMDDALPDKIAEILSKI